MDEKTENIIIKTLVSYIQETNKTLIMVTHSKKVAQTYAENIIEIHQGKVINIKEV